MIVAFALLAVAVPPDQLAHFSLPPGHPVLASCPDAGCAAPMPRSYRVDAAAEARPSAKDRALSAQGADCRVADRRCPKRGRRILTLGLPD